ncbi:MAG: hypothetical protein O4861_05380 [Trichodesmium sp. St16_bin4-tuft]|nr:hypothetical protein [Trichodesmium sp. St16_bin4-tuft]
MVYDHQRLAALEKTIEILYDRLGYFEKELAIIPPGSDKKFEIQQRIKTEVLPDIRRHEKEYWELYPMQEVVIPEDQAASQLVQVEQAVTSLEGSFAEYPREMLALLAEIRARLDGLDRSASAKLKVAIPLIPAIASYELEMDTEGVMSKTWKPLRGLIMRLHPTFFRK